MKKILFVLITLITVSNFSHASFPITESNTEILKTIISEDTEPDETPKHVYIQRAILFFSLLGLALYFLIRAFRRAWRRDVPWLKKLLRWKNIWYLLLVIPIFFILGLLAGGGVSGL